MNKIFSLLASAILAVAVSSAAFATEHEPAADAAKEMKCGASMGKEGMKGGGMGANKAQCKSEGEGCDCKCPCMEKMKGMKCGMEMKCGAKMKDPKTGAMKCGAEMKCGAKMKSATPAEAGK
ncbi:MAG: hypothetical protein CVU17_08195 [Betaproteobacteria bacterium HGW-Betaproteobacteria-11]|nr:MAG: hypothetical protein CVU17_08195 [Betaproteobacteria bacterium HGW-Betaproteobacteria-11]